jgi:hypothetical protein
MNGISDAVVIGVVLGLIFAAVSYYIYSRTTQIERKVGLIENILLDLKVTTEQALLNATDGGGGGGGDDSRQDLHQANRQDNRPNLSQGHTHEGDQEDGEVAGGTVVVERLEQRGAQQDEQTRDVVVDQASRGRSQPAQPIVVEREQAREPAENEGHPVTTNYELMTYKELVALAKKMGIGGLRGQSKAYVIDAIRAHEQGGNTSSSASVGGADDSATRSGQSNLAQWATGTVNFQDGAVNPLNDIPGDGPGAINALEGDGAPLGASDVETSLVA